MKIRYSSAIVLFFIVGLQASAQEREVVVRGSASMLHLCQEIISLYNKEMPGNEVGVNVAEAIQSLPSGERSIWQTVRQLDTSQKKQLQQKLGSEVLEIPIAIQGTVVIVNPKNPITDLTMGQLRAIYTAKVSNWKEVGGKDAAIRLYSTEATVGGSLFFTDFVLHGEDIDTAMRGFANAKDTEKAVAADPDGIGLIPLPGEKDVKYPRVHRTAEGPGVEASIENIRTLRYPLSTEVYWVIASQHPEIVSRFVKFTLSQKGQLVAEAAGYYPLNPTERIEASAAASETHNPKSKM